MQHQKTSHHAIPSLVQWAGGTNEPIYHLNVEEELEEEKLEESHQTCACLQLYKKLKYRVCAILYFLWVKTTFTNRFNTVSN